MSDKRERISMAVTTMVVADSVRDLMSGLTPGQQASVICDVFAGWLAGMPVGKRQALIDRMMVGVRELVEIADDMAAAKNN